MSTDLKHLGTVRIETERLFLRLLTQNDAEKVFENWTSDEEVTKFMRWSRHLNVDDTRSWLKKCEENADTPTFYGWGIFLKNTNEPIGWIDAFENNNEHGRYEMGYELCRKYWGRGYTTEALKHVIGFLSKEVGVKMFAARHAFENPASGAVMRHVGFKYVKDGFYVSFDGMRKFPSKIYYLDT